MNQPLLPHLGKYLRDRYERLDGEKDAMVSERLDKLAGVTDMVPPAGRFELVKNRLKNMFRRGRVGALDAAAKAVPSEKALEDLMNYGPGGIKALGQFASHGGAERTGVALQAAGELADIVAEPLANSVAQSHNILELAKKRPRSGALVHDIHSWGRPKEGASWGESLGKGFQSFVGAGKGVANAINQSPFFNAMSTAVGAGAPAGGTAFGPAAKMTPQAEFQSRAFENAKVDMPQQAKNIARADFSGSGGMPAAAPAPAAPKAPAFGKRPK